MNTTIGSHEVRAYLDAVRAQLSDVPESDLDDLLEDLEQHLLEVAAEDEGSLEDRLGLPSAYAEELRASAGLPSGDVTDRRKLSTRMLKRVQRSALGRAVDAAAESKAARAIRAFLPDLRPGWWVLRGYLAVAALALITSNTYQSNPVIPDVGSPAIGLVVVAAAIWLSVKLGRASNTEPKARRMSTIANIAVGFVAFAAMASGANAYPMYWNEAGYSSVPYLHHADGTPITNICPYSGDGTLLNGVLLFDEQGRPIINLASPDGTINELRPTIQNAYPHPAREITDTYTGNTTTLYCPMIPKQPPSAAPPGVPTPIPTK